MPKPGPSYPSVTVGLTALLLATSAREARADDQSIAQAAVLAREADKLMKAGQVPEACEKYKQAQSLDPNGDTLLSEALCREKEGKTGTAFNLFVQAEKSAKDENRSDHAATAKQHENALFAKLARLVVVVPPEDMVAGLEVDAGVQVVPQDQWGKPFPVDPGTLPISASAPSKETWQSTVDVRSGGKQTVTIGVLKAGAGPVVKPPTPLPQVNLTKPPGPQTPGTQNPTVPPPVQPPAPPPGHRKKGIVGEFQLVAGLHTSLIYQGPNSLVVGTQYLYQGDAGSQFDASCGTTTSVPGAGICRFRYSPQAAFLGGAQAFLGYGFSESVQVGVRVLGGAHFPIGFEVLGGPSFSIHAVGPVWLGATGLLGTSQTRATVIGAKGSVPPALNAANGGNFVDIGSANLAGGVAGGNKQANAWGTFEVGASVEVSIQLTDNLSGITGGWTLSAWPYGVWSPASSAENGPGGAFGIPIGFGYRFY